MLPIMGWDCDSQPSQCEYPLKLKDFYHRLSHAETECIWTNGRFRISCILVVSSHYWNMCQHSFTADNGTQPAVRPHNTKHHLPAHNKLCICYTHIHWIIVSASLSIVSRWRGHLMLIFAKLCYLFTSIWGYSCKVLVLFFFTASWDQFMICFVFTDDNEALIDVYITSFFIWADNADSTV